MIDLEKFCIAFGWAYGTELERANIGEPEDGLTPETLWAQTDEAEREFTRRVLRETFRLAGISIADGQSPNGSK